jgi:hypothetical protein
MKRLFTLISFSFITMGFAANAQSFSISDTVRSTPSGFTNIMNTFNNLTSGNLKVDWKVVATDFPADWLFRSDTINRIGLCDNMLCYSLGNVWPSATTQVTDNYAPGRGDMHIQVDISSSTSTGTHYLTLRLYNNADSNDSATTTYLVSKSPTAVTGLSKSNDESIFLYPNPAFNEININFPATLDVKSVGIYNNIGRMVTSFKVAVNTPTFNIDNLQGGLYFARLMSTSGDVVATLRFTKQ